VLGGDSSDALVVAVGDDRTDEDLFAALPESGISIHVGPSASRARYRVEGVARARELLRALIASDGRDTRA
jgi:trehalose 6-phosphate synthase/phosphatase